MLYMPIMNCTILGDGGWGTTLAKHLLESGNNVAMWGPFAHNLKILEKTGRNDIFLKGIAIPRTLRTFCDINEALDFAQVVVCVVPSRYLTGTLKKITHTNRLKKKIFLSATKGFDPTSGKLPSECIRSLLPVKKVAVLSGPTIAREVALGMPVAATIASKSTHEASILQKLFSKNNLRIYLSRDIIGVEIAGALKNIIGIAAGISDGLKCGSNAKAALLTRGLAEITRFAVAYGAKEKTLMGLSGVGDLITTCISDHGRNHWLGREIAKGKRVSKITASTQMVVEGVVTVKTVRKLARRKKIDMPITEEIYKVLYGHKSPSRAVQDLMARELKKE